MRAYQCNLGQRPGRNLLGFCMVLILVSVTLFNVFTESNVMSQGQSPSDEQLTAIHITDNPEDQIINDSDSAIVSKPTSSGPSPLATELYGCVESFSSVILGEVKEYFTANYSVPMLDVSSPSDWTKPVWQPGPPKPIRRPLFTWDDLYLDRVITNHRPNYQANGEEYTELKSRGHIEDFSLIKNGKTEVEEVYVFQTGGLITDTNRVVVWGHNDAGEWVRRGLDLNACPAAKREPFCYNDLSEQHESEQTNISELKRKNFQQQQTNKQTYTQTHTQEENNHQPAHTTRNHKTQEEVNHDATVSEFKDVRNLVSFVPAQIVNKDVVVLSCELYCNLYWHFVGEVLQSLASISRAGLLEPDNLKNLLFHTTTPHGFHREWLKQLGIRRKQIVSGPLITTGRLILGKYSKCGGSRMPSWSWILSHLSVGVQFEGRDKNKQVMDPKIGKRSIVFIERTWARVLDDLPQIIDAFRPLADKYNLDIDIFSDRKQLHVDATLARFARAQVVVAVHGAGAVNAIVSPSDLCFVEIFSKEWGMNLVFMRLMELKGAVSIIGAASSKRKLVSNLETSIIQPVIECLGAIHGH